MKDIEKVSSSYASAVKAHHSKMLEYYKRQNAMIEGICNIIMANQLTVGEAEDLLKKVQHKLKCKCVYARKR